MKFDYKKILLIIFLIFICSIFVAFITRPERVSYEGTSDTVYEKVSAKVIGVRTRQVPKSKYTTATSYDVYLLYDNEQYVWTTDTDPKLGNGVYRDFYLYDGKMYKTPQALEKNIQVMNSSGVFKFFTFISVCCFPAMFVILLVGMRKKK